jgi:hypothetical protein
MRHTHTHMALMPEYKQASTRAPQPSQPSTGSPMSSAPVSPYHQQGSTKPSVAPATHSPCHFMPFASMGGESPRARLHDRLQGLMAPSPMSFGASMPSHSPHHFVPFVSMGGECTPSAGRLQLPTRATRYGCQGSMVPLPVTSGAARPSPSLAHPFSPTWSSPTHPLPMMGGSTASAACRALAWAHPAYSAPPSPFADKLSLLVVRLAYSFYQSPVVPGCEELTAIEIAAINAVVSALQHWYQRHSIH